MTTDVSHHLRGFQRIGGTGIVDLGIVYLRMGYHTSNTCFQTFLKKVHVCLTVRNGTASQPTFHCVITERAAQGIAHIVGESGNTRHLWNVGFHA